jgi:hypothetical protein
MCSYVNKELPGDLSRRFPLSGSTATAAHLIDDVDLEEGVGQLRLAGGGVDGALAGGQAREDQRLVEVHALIVRARPPGGPCGFQI